jgi:CheY-specific phosphatase CheX
MIYPIEAFHDPNFCENLMRLNATNGTTKVLFDGPGSPAERTVEVSTKELIFNIILWKPFIRFKIPIVKSLYTNIDAFPEDCIAKIQTEQYHYLLDNTQVPGKDIRMAMWDAINDFNNFVLRHLGAYQRSMSILSLARVQCDPKVKAIIDQKIDPRLGTEAAEIKHNRVTKELIKLIGTRGEIENNVLIDFMEAKQLKSNQIPQQMYAYGTRSDITDHMMSHVINESAMSGLKSVKDFATESLSAKKSAFFNKTVIKNTQYFARVLRLNCSQLPYMYKGDCGNRLLVPVTIPAKHVEQYIDKVVFFEGSQVAISRKNFESFKDKRVAMISPLTCRYTDGVCEHCSGRASSRPWEFIPSGLHLGIYSATKVGKSVSQMVLSAKHLIKTKSLTYALPTTSAKYFLISDTEIFFKEKFLTKLDKLSIKIPTSALGHLADLGGENLGSIEESFSDIESFELIDESTGATELLEIASDRYMPFFSVSMLKHMAKNISNIVSTDDDCVVIPLKGFNPKRSIMKYIVVNDDMVAFTRQVDNFLKAKISDHTSLTSILHDFTKIVYDKTTINIFFIEVLLKTFLRRKDGVSGLPVVDDVNNVVAGNMKDNIEAASVSIKLSHERVAEYVSAASSYVRNKGVGTYDRSFGFTT